jgi:glycosyltransferase involved in cell wall biosynthesis
MHVLISALSRFSKPTGLCRHAANLAQCLASRDKVSKVTLVLGTWQKVSFQTCFNLNSEKIELVPIDIKNTSLSRNTWFIYGLPEVAKSYHPNIVHLSFPIPFFRSFFSSTVVSTIHDLYPYEFPENFGYFNSLFNRLFLKQCVNQSDGLACVSCQTLERLKFYFPNILLKKHIDVVYNYVKFSTTPQKFPNPWLRLLEAHFGYVLLSIVRTRI